MTAEVASLLLVLLVILDLALVATRVAYQVASQARLLNLRESQEKGAVRALALLPKALRLRAGLNLALVLARLLLAWTLIELYYSALSKASPWWALLLLLLAGLVIFWCEWGLERRINRSPETWAVRLSWFGRVVKAIFSWPATWMLAMEGEAQNNPDAGNLVTEQDLHSLVDAGQEDGVFEQEESRMIFSIVRLGETLAREIMVPRLDVVSLDVRATPAEAAAIMLKTGHSRVPVYEETIDQVLGMLYIKDLLRAYHEINDVRAQADAVDSPVEGTFNLRSLLRPAYFIPEAKRLDVLLGEMQDQRIHMAIVVDEYGGVAGIVTLEDIVEEVVGEIKDEYDQAEESPIQAFEDGTHIFLGRVDLDDFNETMGSDLSKDDADTIGGFIYSRLGKVPLVGETVPHGNLLLKVEQVSARRIRKVRASWISEAAPGDAGQPMEKGNIDDRVG